MMGDLFSLFLFLCFIGVLLFCAILRWVLGTGEIIDQQDKIIKRLDVAIELLADSSPDDSEIAHRKQLIVCIETLTGAVVGEDGSNTAEVAQQLKNLNAKIKVARATAATPAKIAEVKRRQRP